MLSMCKGPGLNPPVQKKRGREGRETHTHTKHGGQRSNLITKCGSDPNVRRFMPDNIGGIHLHNTPQNGPPSCEKNEVPTHAPARINFKATTQKLPDVKGHGFYDSFM